VFANQERKKESNNSQNQNHEFARHQKSVLIYIDRTSPVSEFRLKERLAADGIYSVVAGIPRRKSKQHQYRGGVAILY